MFRRLFCLLVVVSAGHTAAWADSPKPPAKPIRALVVNGWPAKNRFDQPAAFLSMALNPFDGTKPTKSDGVRTREIAAADLADADKSELSEYDCVFLCDVPRFARGVVQRLEAFVRGGGGVVVCLGPHVDVVAYNRDLYRNGKGLSPVRLLGARQAARDHCFRFGFTKESLKQRPLAVFTDERDRANLVRPTFEKFVRTSAPAPSSQVRTILSFEEVSLNKDKKTSAAGVAMLEWRPFGNDNDNDKSGRFVLFTSTVNRDWNNWPASVTFVPMTHELVRLVVRRSQAADDGVTTSLFDGKTLNGWTIENDCKASVKDGMILLEEGNGWLRSHNTFGDFKLHVEWKALKKEQYDAGIYLRTLPGGKPFPKKSYQANLLQGKEGNIGNLPGAVSKELIKPGEWNVFDITVVGDTVEMVINGKKAYKVGGIKNPTGYVGLQVEVPKGGQFLVRNVRVTELGFSSLFNGKDFTGWEGAGMPAETCWAVEDGALVGLRKRGPWLRSKKEHGDFNLRMEYLVEEGANSGIYVRVPKNGNHHRAKDDQPPAGVEIQILDDKAKKHAKLKPYQYSASIYDIAGAEPRCGNPVGQWNHLEINCHGYHVTIIHNGVVVVDVTGESHPKFKLRQLKGYLGIQNHGGGVKYRNVRIGPAAADLTLPRG